MSCQAVNVLAAAGCNWVDVCIIMVLRMGHTVLSVASILARTSSVIMPAENLVTVVSGILFAIAICGCAEKPGKCCSNIAFAAGWSSNSWTVELADRLADKLAELALVFSALDWLATGCSVDAAA